MAEFVSLVLESNQGLIYIHICEIDFQVHISFGVGWYLILMGLYTRIYLSDKSI